MLRVAISMVLYLGAVASAQEVLLPPTLDLETAQRIALEENPTLQAAASRVEQAKSRVKQAQSAYYPRLDASYTASQTWLSDRVVEQQRLLAEQQTRAVSSTTTFGAIASLLAPDVEIDDTAENYTAGLTASYVLFDGFQRKFTKAAARFGELETEAALREARRLLLDAVASAYHGVQLARENVAIAESDEAFNTRLLTDAKARLRVGAGSLSDVLNFEVRLRAATSARFAAERDMEVARIVLATLMGLPEAGLPASTELAPLPERSDAEEAAPVLDAAIARGIESRPDVERARLAVERTGAQHRAVKSLYYPTVTAFAAQEWNRTEDSHFREEDRAATVGIQVNYTLFAGGRNRATVLEAREAAVEADRLLTDAELNAAAEVREALADFLTAREQLALQRETAGYVQENRDLVEKAYAAGAREGSLTRLNEAQRDLTEAQGRLAQARVAVLQTWHAFRTATGETVEAGDAADTE